MSKPVDLDELGMVLRNLQRRQRAKPTTLAATPEPANAANIDVADWQFDPNRWSLSFAQGPRVQLSMTEMLILQYLIGAAGQVASRDQLLRLLGHHVIRVSRRNLYAMLSRLPKQTEPLTGQRMAGLLLMFRVSGR